MAKQDKPSHSDREHFWAKAVECWQDSGLTVRGYCRRRRLSEAGFYWWRRRLSAVGRLAEGDGTRSRRRSKATPTFISIRAPEADDTPVPAAEKPSAEPVATTGRIEIALAGGRVVRIGAGFDPATLQAVLGVLEGRPC